MASLYLFNVLFTIVIVINQSFAYEWRFVSKYEFEKDRAIAMDMCSQQHAPLRHEILKTCARRAGLDMLDDPSDTDPLKVKMARRCVKANNGHYTDDERKAIGKCARDARAWEEHMNKKRATSRSEQ